jgi:CheY-like chemotaxis protein
MNAQSSSADGLTVVVVDDNPYDVELIESALHNRLNCLVIALSDRDELVDVLAQKLPDVIISDSNLPRFDGYEALRLTRLLCPNVPFIFCSGNENPALKVAALAQGAKHWVSKSDLELLAETVKQVCGGTTG